MKKKNIILSSLLTLVLCVSLIIGGTFALFTSESKTNIAVTSGKVDVIATIENLKLHSPKLIAANGDIVDNTNVATDKLFVNGGSASIENGVKLTLDKVTPGDKVEFQIKITNNSNVAIQYRTVIRVLDDNGLASGLVMKIGEDYDGSTKYTNWAPMSVAETTKVLDCSVELPTKAGNEYQDKTCTIVYTVEAVQGNAQTDNNVAKVGDTAYATLEGAIAAAQAGETVEIIRPGTYAPFTLDKAITVKGINTGDKASSTVIKTTASANIKAHADNVVLESLYIDGTVKFDESALGFPLAQYGGIINGNIHPDSDTSAAKLTVNKCTIVGEGTNDAVSYHGGELVFTNNTVDNVYRINVFDNHKLTSSVNHTISGNTINNVCYEALIINAYNDTTVTITGNTINDATMVSLNDCNEAGTAFANVVINGNTSVDTLYRLGWFNSGVTTPTEITLGANEKAITLTRVSFKANGNDLTKYQIVTADGRNFTPDIGHSGSTAALAASVILETGDYKIVEKGTDNLLLSFTIDMPDAGKTPTVELPSVSNVGTVEQLAAMMAAASQQSNGDLVINITSDIDANNAWTAFEPKGYTGVNKVIINGNGHTITHLNEPLMVGSFAGAGYIVFNDLTIANSTITRTDAYNALGIGVFIGYSDSSGEVTFNNCHLTDSSITCGDDLDEPNNYVGGFMGYVSGAGAVFNNCSVSNTQLSGEKSVGAFVGHGGANVTINTAEVSGCTISETLPGRTSAGAAALVGRMSGGCVLTLKGTIKTNGNTINQGVAVSPTAVNLYTALGTPVTTEATLVTE